MTEVEDVLGRLVGRRVRLQCHPRVPYENPVVGDLERIAGGEVLVRVHPTRIDAIPIDDIIEVEVVTDE